MGDVHYLFGEPLEEADDYFQSLTPHEQKRIRERNSFLKQIGRGVGKVTAAASVNWSLRRLEAEMVDTDFAEAVDMMIEMRDEAVEQAAWEAAVVRKNATMIQFWLYNRRSADWRDPRTRDSSIGSSAVDREIVHMAVEAIRQAAIADAARSFAEIAKQPAPIEATVRDDGSDS